MASTTNRIDTFAIGINEGGVQMAAPTAIGPTAPPVANAASSAFESFGPLAAKGLALFAGTWDKEEKEKANAQLEENKATLTRTLTAKINGIEAARTAGRMTATAASAATRKLYQDAIFSDPSYKETIDSTFQGSNAYGIGAGIKAAEATELDATKRANDAGFGNVFDSPEKQEQNVLAFNEYNLAKSRLDLVKQQAEVSKAKDEASLAATRVQAANSLRHFVAKSFPQFDSQLDSLRKDVLDGKINPDDAVNLARRKFSGMSAGLVSSVGGYVEQSQINAVSGVFEDRIKAFEETLTGKRTAESFENKAKIDNRLAEEALYDAAPDLRALTALSKMVGNQSPGIINQVTLSGNRAMNILLKNSKPTGVPQNTMDGTTDSRDALAIVKHSIGNADNPAEYSTHVSNVLKSIPTYGPHTEPKNWKDTVDFISSNEFKKFRERGGQLDPAAMQNARDVFVNYYETSAMGAIKDQITNAQITVMPADIDRNVNPFLPAKSINVPVNEQVRLINDKGTFRFEAQSATGPQPYAIVRQAQVAADGLNKTVAKVMNTLVKAQSNLNPNMSYEDTAKGLEEKFFRNLGYVQRDIPENVRNSVSTLDAQQKEMAATDYGYGKRADNTNKGKGFFGEVNLGNGNIATEFSVGVSIDGKEEQIPTLVPTLTSAEKKVVEKAARGEGDLTDAVVQKAVEFARKRKAEGKPYFATPAEEGKLSW